MKECGHCGNRYADAAQRCPQCGVGPDDRISEVKRTVDLSLDEGFGPERKRQLIIIIVVIDVLIMAVALAWFLGR